MALRRSLEQINFDYTPAEWGRISTAVARVRREPLSDIERDALRVTADDYLSEQRVWRSDQSAVAMRGARRKAWEKIGRKIAELSRAVDELVALPGSQVDVDLLFFVTDEMRAALNGDPAPKPNVVTTRGRTITIPFTNLTRWMSADETRALLSQLRVSADRHAAELRRGPSYFWTYTGRMEPRVPYMQQILWLWTHHFSGALTLSIDSTRIPARVYGPLVDYVAAVAGPTMKGTAPKASALRDCIKRQKKFYAWLSENERKYGSRGVWAYNYAKSLREPDEDPYGDVASWA